MQKGLFIKQGPRPYMEDTYSFNPDFRGGILGGVYDGHGGETASEFMADNFEDLFQDSLSSGKSIDESFGDVYFEASEELSDQGSGACAVNFYIKEGTVYFANVGDSHLLVIKEEEVLQLTEEHRIDNPEERSRVEEAGAKIRYPYFMKGSRGRMPTRGVGDEHFRSVGLTPEPFTGSYNIKPGDRFLLAGTDGLFDFIENGEIGDIAEGFNEPDKFAEALGREIMEERRGNDNIAILTLYLGGLVDNS